jgi:hypothetical protein
MLGPVVQSEMNVKTMKLLLLLGLCCAVLPAMPAKAQEYDLSWFCIDGGGGTSTGGDYSLSGTIGQADAGVLSGGNYTLVGGFWSAVAPAPSSTPSPEISVSVSGNNVIISWPVAASGFTLEQSGTLNPATWQAVPQTANNNGTTMSVVLTAPAGTMFYRLKH